MAEPRKHRVNMRVPLDLFVWAQGYLKSRHKTLTQVLVDHLVDLRERESKEKRP